MPFVLVRCATQSFDALAAAEIDLGTVIGIGILGLGPRLIFDWPLAAALQEKRLLGPKELGFSLVNPGTGCLGHCETKNEEITANLLSMINGDCRASAVNGDSEPVLELQLKLLFTLYSF